MSYNYHKYMLLGFQILAHIALIAAFFTFSFADWGFSFLVYFLTGCLGVSITYHRFLSHKSWKAPEWWIYFGSLCGSYGLIGSPVAWANNHIAHHKFADTERDPHSPIHNPWWKVQWFSMLTSESSLKYGLSNLNTFQIFLHKNYFLIHLFIVVLFLIFGSIHLLCVFYLVPAAILWNFASFVNTLNHSKFGYRNFETKDYSVNNLITGILTWGEGWHNNHHSRPGSYVFSVKWWEFDISSWIIHFIKKNEHN